MVSFPASWRSDCRHRYRRARSGFDSWQVGHSAASSSLLPRRSFEAFISLFNSEPRTLLCRKLVLRKRNNSWSAPTNLQQIYKNYFWTKHRSSVEDVLIENGLLTIKQIRDLEICIFLYKYSNQCLPAALQNLFSIKATCITTRSTSKYIPPLYRATVRQQSIKFLGPKIWNKLPPIIEERKPLRSFVRKAKAHLISNL